MGSRQCICIMVRPIFAIARPLIVGGIDSQVFRLTSLPGHTPAVEEVDKWRNKVLPTFNRSVSDSLHAMQTHRIFSMAVESQLAHLDPEIVSENMCVLFQATREWMVLMQSDRIYLNDDQFFVLPFPPSAFHSPLYGPVFRLVNCRHFYEITRILT
jgi:hypothetical protein